MKGKHTSRGRLELGALIGSLLLLLACGSVTTSAVDGGPREAASEASSETSDRGGSGDLGGVGGGGHAGSQGGGGGATGGGGGTAPSCAAWPNGTPPYCSTCHCANGNTGQGCCVCGTLACCDPSCQS